MKSVNFNIIERSSTQIFNDIYPKIVNDISNGVKIIDIKKKYQLNDTNWVKYRKELLKDGILSNEKKPKYYHYNQGTKRYVVSKRIDGRNTYFFSSLNEQDAQIVAEKLQRCDWDKTKLPKIVESLRCNYE